MFNELRIMQRFTNTFSIRFYCRASRVGSDGTFPIELAINLQGERFISHLLRKAKPKEFEKLMCALPPWAEGLPLKAEGWRGTRDKK